MKKTIASILTIAFLAMSFVPQTMANWFPYQQSYYYLCPTGEFVIACGYGGNGCTPTAACDVPVE